jgi:hypothetical protein
MSDFRLSRREFIHATAGVASASVLGGSIFLDADSSLAEAQLAAPSDHIRFGIVGVGMEGSGWLFTAIHFEKQLREPQLCIGIVGL